MVGSTIQTIEWLGVNKTAVGLATLFGLLAGFEFVARYIFKSAIIAKIGLKLGIHSAAKSYRRSLQKNLVHIRRIRGNHSEESCREMVRFEFIILPIYVLVGTMTGVGLWILYPQEKSEIVGVISGFLIGRSLRVLAIYLGAKANISMIRNPGLYRQRHIAMLRSLPR